MGLVNRRVSSLHQPRVLNFNFSYHSSILLLFHRHMVTLHAAAAVAAGLLLQFAPLLTFADPTNPPDTSLARLPIAYYGAQWNRDAANIEDLSRMAIVILMQVCVWLRGCMSARECYAMHGCSAVRVFRCACVRLRERAAALWRTKKFPPQTPFFRPLVWDAGGGAVLDNVLPKRQQHFKREV